MTIPFHDQCGAVTHQLNCGCCEAVIFRCQLPKEHTESHMCTSTYYTLHPLTVLWPKDKKGY